MKFRSKCVGAAGHAQRAGACRAHRYAGAWCGSQRRQRAKPPSELMT